MQKIEKNHVEELLKKFAKQLLYIHFEVTPGGFLRNGMVEVLDTFIAGEGPYRVALKLAENGWIRIEGLTDYELDDQQRLFLVGHDELGRLTTALQLSRHPFDK